MNKYILCLAAALSLGAFTACEDVPAPYGINNNTTPETPDNPGEEGVIINAPFSTSLDGFTAINTVGEYPFAIDGSYGYVKVTSFVNPTNNAAESWLVSPTFSLKNVDKAHVTFEYILRYANANELKTNYLVRFSDNYSGNPATATWKDVTFSPIQAPDWKTWTTADVDVPAEFLGKENLVVALYYKTDQKAATWEVKNFAIAAGAPGSTDNPSTPDTPVEDNSITVKPSSWNLDNATSVPTITLSDGTKLEFASGGNTNDPKYYTGGTNVRMYPKNTLTVTSKKKIAKIILNCDTFQSTICNASGDVSANPGSVNVDKAVITVSNINALSTILTNISSKTGAASQIRFTSITIVYAE